MVQYTDWNAWRDESAMRGKGKGVCGAQEVSVRVGPLQTSPQQESTLSGFVCPEVTTCCSSWLLPPGEVQGA